MVIDKFSSKIIFLDTAPLIYFIEGHSIYQSILSKLFSFNDKGGFSFITSSITILEVLVKPLREGKADLAKQYRDILTKASGIEVLRCNFFNCRNCSTIKGTIQFKNS